MDTYVLYKKMERKWLHPISRQHFAGISLEKCVTFEFQSIHNKRKPDLTLSIAVVQVKLGRQIIITYTCKVYFGQSQWSRGLRGRSEAAHLLRLWVRIPPGHGFIDFCLLWVLCVVGTGLCDELITRPEESCRLWCVVVCDVETSWMRRPWPNVGAVAPKRKFFSRKKKYFRWVVYLYYATVLHSFAGPYWNISVKMVVEKE